MLDEALQYALDFCRQKLTQEQVIERGEGVVSTLRTRLTEVDDASGMTGFVIGGTLKKLKEKDVWKKLPGVGEHWTFENFCEQRLGKSRAWAYQRMRVWEKSNTMGMKAEDVNEIGWTVADKILSKSESANDVTELVDKYRDAESREEFFAELDGKEKARPIEKQKRRKRTVKLQEEENQFYEETLEVVATRLEKKLYETLTEEQAIMFIITDWRHSH